ncbi:DNA repair exonuclease [Alcaligenaceae bacterium A4P071]|nr:DNA repair exonuclease [Alcaligenaceae bacterium A4P071]
MATFIHTADWQIGRQYGQFEVESGALLAEARFDTVAGIARLAQARGVDAVLVAGDVFDTQAVSDRTIRRLFAALSAYAGPWVMIPGNHDAALAESVWTRAQALGCVPPNVHLALEPGVLMIGDTIAVLAAPLTQRHTYDDVTGAFDRLDTPAGALRIGLAHGSVTGKLDEGIDSANPIAADRAVTARLDYLALGDWHGCLRLDARTWYSGTPEPERFRGNDPGDVLIVRIDAAGAEPVVDRLRVARYRWLSWQAPLLVDADIDALAQRLATLGSDDVLRLDVSGSLTLMAWERLQGVLGEADARVRALRVDTAQVVLAPDAHDLSTLGLDGYVADVAHTLQAMQAEGGTAQGETARDALRLLVQFQQEATRTAGSPA